MARSPAAITLAWLVRLRWGAVWGQTVTIAVAVFGLGLALPTLPLALLVSVTVVSNVALAMWLKRATVLPPSSMGFVMAADTVVLTALLYFSGGPSNPFSVLYLVHVTLAALVLGMGWAGAVVALSAVLYAALFRWNVPIAGMDHAHHGGSAFSVHLQGMWVAFTVAASLIAYFVARVAAALRDREAELVKAQAIATRSEKLASLTTLAAGAAHELGTPLGTIAVASRELERSIGDNPSEALDDARLIRTEVDRCRAIVQRMSAQAGVTMGELPERTTAESVLARCADRLDPSVVSRVRVEGERGETLTFVCPGEGLVQVLLSLIHNGLYASRADLGTVVVSAAGTPHTVRFAVEDEGTGVGPDVLVHIGEPFFTTKPPGEGMGLGLFLARTFAERWHGSLGFDSRKGAGTRVTVELPRIMGERHD